MRKAITTSEPVQARAQQPASTAIAATTVRTCTLGPRRLDDETAWIVKYQQMLEARYDRLGAFLERTKGTL